MKRFDELNEQQQKIAEEKALVSLLQAILSGAVRFNDALNHDNLQARIDAACEKAEQVQTPWFAHEYILDTCQDELEDMARCNAEDALYPEAGEYCVAGVAL